MSVNVSCLKVTGLNLKVKSDHKEASRKKTDTTTKNRQNKHREVRKKEKKKKPKQTQDDPKESKQN